MLNIGAGGKLNITQCVEDVSGSHVSLSLVVHKLRPADIKVVAALGDSLTVRFITQCTINSRKVMIIYIVP